VPVERNKRVRGVAVDDDSPRSARDEHVAGGDVEVHVGRKVHIQREVDGHIGNVLDVSVAARLEQEAGKGTEGDRSQEARFHGAKGLRAVPGVYCLP